VLRGFSSVSIPKTVIYRLLIWPPTMYLTIDSSDCRTYMPEAQKIIFYNQLRVNRARCSVVCRISVFHQLPSQTFFLSQNETSPRKKQLLRPENKTNKWWFMLCLLVLFCSQFYFVCCPCFAAINCRMCSSSPDHGQRRAN
jgi:hypothetical protein